MGLGPLGFRLRFWGLGFRARGRGWLRVCVQLLSSGFVFGVTVGLVVSACGVEAAGLGFYVWSLSCFD